MSMTTPHESDADVERFASRVFTQVVGAMEVLSLYVGDRLGLYRALAQHGPATVAELSARTGMQLRYAREWLEQQAVAGILAIEGEGDPDERRFRLPPAHETVLVDARSLVYSSPSARIVVAAASRIPDLLKAYVHGGGVGWAEFGNDARDAQGDINRPWFESALGDALAGVQEVNDILSRPGASIADVGCGHGWSTIALARAYPDATVDGFDVDEPSIDAARQHADGQPNVTFFVAGGERLADQGNGGFDAAFVFEALHDMPRPVEVLSAMRRAVKDDGLVIVMDEAVADDFAPDGDEVERIMYAYSLFICLPDGMSGEGSSATGTVMRPATLERYARDAGFSGVDILPIEGFAAFRFYALRP